VEPVIANVVNNAAYNAFYNLIAISLETHNVERAGDYMRSARFSLSIQDANRLERELTADYYEFT
jgi:hypothetical protein